MPRLLLDEVEVDPTTARIYAEGWQSWSPTTWYPPAVVGLRPDLDWQHTMRFRPGVAVADDSVQAEGLLVVDPGTGAPARVYAAPDAQVGVPTLWATTMGDRLHVEASHVVAVEEHAEGAEAALAAHADAFARNAGVTTLRPAPNAWCSWYRYFEEVTADDVRENLLACADQGLDIDVVQIDDGWSTGLGELMRPRQGFEPVARIAEEIRASGKEVGIWLAPFLVGADTTLARQHPDWLTGDAGFNWGQRLVGLDLTHPGVQDHLRELLTGLREAGVTYLKLDFLYAGAVPSARHRDVTGTQAYRAGLELIREAAGPATYLLGCGAPILPSVGLLDGMRVSPDTFHAEAQDGSAGLRGLMPLAARAWQHGRFWMNDPDCLVARPSYALREQWAEACSTYGGARTVSDRIADLDDWGLATTRRLLADRAPSGPFPADVVAAGARVAAAERAHRQPAGDLG
ncbi:putative Glycoside hydrolase clan GH-D [metagenome]|uniref:Putative Glycoside hydrolase clan GH-D n=1 Tax=metagenome TaxID=256318 RepID=A0A2P2CEP7_9ZZZZ